MGINRSATIAYGAFVTDDDQYELHGPYSIDESFESITVTWAVVVTVSGTDEQFYDACAALEAALAVRDGSLVITFPGGAWSYLFGQNALNTSCGFSKGGDMETDTGRSRSYTVTFSAMKPAFDEGGMFAIQSLVAYDPARIRTIQMTGEVRGQSGASAWDRYQAIIGTWDTQIQNVVDSGATWELQGEDVNFDRTNHIVTFNRTFAELIDEDAPGQADNPEIAQQRIIFTRVSAYPGDSDPDVNRPERFVVEYSCSVDKELKLGLDELSSLYEDSIFDWIKNRFNDQWGPQAFAVTDHERQFIPTMNTISARLIIMAYMEGSDVLESSRTETYKDERNIDYTPVWDEDELSAYADQGFMIRLRETVETKTLLGQHDSESPLEPNTVQSSGWNKLSGANGATPFHIGEPPDQVELTILTSSLIERYTKKPSGGGGTGTGANQTADESVPTPAEYEQRRRETEITRGEGSGIPGSRT